MSRARERILARLSGSLGPVGDPGRTAAVDSWSGAPAAGPLPRVAGDALAAFIERAEAAAAEVHRVRDDAHAVERILAEAGPAADRAPLVAAPHDRLRRLPWPRAGTPEFRNAGASDPVGVCIAWAGIAETGSLVLLSGPGTPTALAFLPERLFCLLDSGCVLPHPEDVWSRLRSEAGVLPRGVNLITGPSRTADVEQTIQLGAHGPRRLIILLT